MHRVRGVINAAKIKDPYDGRSVELGVTPERAIARLQEDVQGLPPGFRRMMARANAYSRGHVQRVGVPGQDKIGGMDQNGSNR